MQQENTGLRGTSKLISHRCDGLIESLNSVEARTRELDIELTSLRKKVQDALNREQKMKEEIQRRKDSEKAVQTSLNSANEVKFIAKKIL